MSISSLTAISAHTTLDTPDALIDVKWFETATINPREVDELVGYTHHVTT